MEMKKLTDGELLDAIARATNVVANKRDAQKVVHQEFDQLPEDATFSDEYITADNGLTIYEDDEQHARIPIEITDDKKNFVVYQDIANGGIYPYEEGDDPYADEVQEALVGRGQAAEGEGMDGDPRKMVEFILGSGAIDSEIVKRSNLKDADEDNL